MASSQDGNMGLYSGYTPGDNGWTAQHNQNWDTLDAFVQATVIDVAITTPPGSPANGAAYVVPSGATGAWASQTNKVAVWVSRSSAWTFYSPKNGWMVYSQATASEYVYNGSAWAVYYSQKLTVPQDYISGLQLIWNSTTSISVGTGSAYISSLGRLSTVNSALTLSSLSLSASTWYHVYLYENAGTPTIECVTTAPTVYQGRASQKTGDNTRRYIGSVRTDASGNVLNFYHDANSNEVMYLVDINTAALHVLTSGTASTVTTVSLSTAIPTTSRLAGLFSENTATNTYVIINNSAVSGSASILYYVRPVDQTVNAKVPTDASQAVQYQYAAAPTGGSFNLWVTGYCYER